MRRCSAPSQCLKGTVSPSPLSDNETEKLLGLFRAPRTEEEVEGSSCSGDDLPVKDAEEVSVGSSEQGRRFFTVLWAKYSTRKHKKWEGDGLLITEGRTVTLKDLEGSTIGRGSGYQSSVLESLESGSTLLAGGKEIEIQDEISREDFDSGKCFTQDLSPVQKVKQLPPSGGLKRLGSRQFVIPFKDANGTTPKCAKLSASAPLYNPCSPSALVMPSPPSFHSLKHNKNDLPVTQVVVDPHLTSCLRPHQREGVEFLYCCVAGMNEKGGMGGILADEMGLGKSLQTIAVIWTLLKQGPYGRAPLLRRILLVCPSSLVQNWSAEFRKWLGQERLKVLCLSKTGDLKEFKSTSSVNPVLIASYDMVIKCDLEELRSLNFDLLVCDEGHRLKNASVKTNCFLTRLDVPRRILLSGTPVQNDLQELYSLVNFVNPGFLGSENQFKKVYEEAIVRSHQSDATTEEKTVGDARAEQLQRMTKEILLRRTAELNSKYLPPKADYVLFCKPSEIQCKVYKSLLGSRVIERTLVTGLTPQHLTCIDALRKLCNHPVLLFGSAKESLSAKEDEHSLYREILPCFPDDYGDDVAVNHSGKLMVLLDLLKSIRTLNSAEKIVVVSNFTQTLNLIGAMCDSLNYSTLRLDGQTPTGQRQKIVKQFNSKHDHTFLFLLSSKAGGVGLNLIGASRIVLFDVDWNPANDLQAMARVWRDGQRSVCHIYRLMTTGTIEEKMFQRQVKKQSLSGAVVGDGASGKADGKLGFSPEELKDIFTLHLDTDCQTHDSILCPCEGKGKPPNPPQSEDAEGPEETKCQLGARNKQKSTVSMAELFGWYHFAKESWEPEEDGRNSCIPQSNSFLSFILHHFTDKRDIGEM